MRVKAYRLAPLLLLLLLIVASRSLMAEGSDVRVFEDDFDSLDESEWFWSCDSVEVGGSVLNLTNGRLFTSRWFSYGTLELRMRLTDPTRDVIIKLQSWVNDIYYDSVSLELISDGTQYKGRTEYMGQSQERLLSATIDDDWHTYKIVWEPDRVLFYIDGALKGELTLTEHVNQFLSRLLIRSDLEGGQLVQLDWVRYTEDYAYSRKVPSLMRMTSGVGTDVIQHFDDYDWFEGNHTLRIKHGLGQPATDYEFWIHIPEAYRNYICEVYDTGVKLTQVRFHRAERRLSFTTHIGGGDIIEIRLVDPEPWMIQIYYTLLPMGIDIGVLLRAYDRLKKRHPALPWILLAILLLLLAFAVYIAIKLLTGVRV